jgi:hypothetical protein
LLFPFSSISFRSLDEIVLARMERQWVKQLRQARLADERRAKRERQLRIQADIAAKRAIIERNNKKRRGGNMGDTALAVTKAVSSAAAIDQLQELEAAAAASEVALAEIDGNGPSGGGGDKEEKDMGASTVAKGPALIEARSRYVCTQLQCFCFSLPTAQCHCYALAAIGCMVKLS